MTVDPGVRILIVDDQDTVLEILRAILRRLGFSNVDTANDGSQALSKLRAAVNCYALVISDWNMQPVTGMQLLQEMRGDERLAETPFIMITADDSAERLSAARNAGVTTYLAKPFSPDSVRRRLVAALGEF